MSAPPTEQISNADGSIAAVIVQSGSGNRAGNPDSRTVSVTTGGIWQKDNRGNTTAEVRQSGNGNIGMVAQEGVSSKYGRITQTGNSNIGTVVQQGGIGGGAALTQAGDDNRATITLQYMQDYRPGNSGVVEVIQLDRSNRAEVQQVGSGRTALWQSGSYNKAILGNQLPVGDLVVEQAGTGNFARATSPGSIAQFGIGNTAVVLGDDSLVINPLGYATRGLVNQQGSANVAIIDQSKSAGDGLAGIDQLGSKNTASITTGGRYSTGKLQIGQQGYANSASITDFSFSGGAASIEQNGVSQQSSIFQTGWQTGQASTVQTGGDNVASIYQDSSDEAQILQDGYRNRARINQSSGGSWTYNVANIRQQGNDSQARIQQTGMGNRAGIRQY